MTDKVYLPDVGEETNYLVNTLIGKLDQHREKNQRLDAYYDAEANLRRHYGGVVPEQYWRLGLALGWSAKAVDALARRCNLEAMVWPDGDLSTTGYEAVWDGNRLGSEVDQAVTSALIHGLSYVVASPGGPGDPAAGMLHFYSAYDATGQWNTRTRRLDNLLVVNGRDVDMLTAFTVHTPGSVLTATLEPNTQRWAVDVSPHPFGVPAAPMVYRPRLRRPMGRTRLTRPVRAIQDAATRTLVRLEGHMDVYAYPEFWMLGADESVFKDADGNQLPKWRVMLGRIKGIPDDPEADPALARADVRKFDASSPQPHLAALNAYSKLFARETSLPDSAVAITDFANPTSADAYDASQYELIAEAEGVTEELAPALRQVVPIAMAMQENLSTVPAEWASIGCQWRDPRYQSRAQMADAGAKAIASVPWLAETETGLRMLGLSPQEVTLALGERQRATSMDRLDRLAALAADVAPPAVAGGL